MPTQALARTCSRRVYDILNKGKIMKKIGILVVAMAFALSLVSCGKKIDSSVWISNLDDAKKAAQAEEKRIFLFFSDDEGDGKSAKLKKNVFEKEDFVKAYTEKYVLVNLDYSSSRSASDDLLAGDYRLFELYDGAMTPYFLILSPEGYVMGKLVFEENADLDTVRITFAEAEEEIAHFEETLAKSKKGTKEERLAAIDELFDNTEPMLTYHLSPLNKLYLSLDKKNESGQYLKHLIALTYAKATDFFMDNEAEKGCEEFAKLVKDKNLTDDDKQMALYTAGYLLAQSGSDNFTKIRDYFEQAYNINPESEAGQSIKMSLDYVQTLVDGSEEADMRAASPEAGNSADSVDSVNASDSPVAENPQN